MQFSSHQVIALVAILAGSLLMYSGTGGFDILLFLIGLTILVAVGIPNRTLEIAIKLRELKFGIRSVPDEDALPQLDDPSSEQQP